MLISKDMQTFIFSYPQQMIWKQNTKEYFYLNEDTDAKCEYLYWMSEDFVVRATEQLWEVFCTKDGSKIATLKK